MQLQHVWEGFDPDAETKQDLTRIEDLWRHARSLPLSEGPWLFGAYSLADVFYAPVAARIIGYDLPVSSEAQAYCAQTISDPAFKKWRAAGVEKVYDPFPYELGLAKRDWPEGA